MTAMTFKIKDFKPGDIVRLCNDHVVEVIAAVQGKGVWIKNRSGKITCIAPFHVVEIEQVMVGERKIGV